MLSASWEVASATQISRPGAAETGTLATQVADHNGGSGIETQVTVGNVTVAPAA